MQKATRKRISSMYASIVPSIPESPTRAYLLAIDRESKAVQKALRIA